MAYGDFKHVNRRTAADKVLHNKAFNIRKNPKYDGYQCGLASMVYRLLDIKTSGGAIIIEIMSNKELEEELRKPIIRKSEKKEVPSSFIDNIWGAGLTDMQLISKSYKRF